MARLIDLHPNLFLAFLSALIATIIRTFGAIYIYRSRKEIPKALRHSQ